MFMLLSVSFHHPPGKIGDGWVVVDVVVACPAYTKQEAFVVDEVPVSAPPVVYLVGGAPTFWGACFARAAGPFVDDGPCLLVPA